MRNAGHFGLQLSLIAVWTWTSGPAVGALFLHDEILGNVLILEHVFVPGQLYLRAFGAIWGLCRTVRVRAERGRQKCVWACAHV